jgi:hypothetical protein
MPRGAHCAAKAVDMLDLLIEFFRRRRTLDQRQAQRRRGKPVPCRRVDTISMVHRPAFIC